MAVSFSPYCGNYEVLPPPQVLVIHLGGNDTIQRTTLSLRILSCEDLCRRTMVPGILPYDPTSRHSVLKEDEAQREYARLVKISETNDKQLIVNRGGGIGMLSFCACRRAAVTKFDTQWGLGDVAISMGRQDGNTVGPAHAPAGECLVPSHPPTHC